MLASSSSKMTQLPRFHTQIDLQKPGGQEGVRIKMDAQHPDPLAGIAGTASTAEV